MVIGFLVTMITLRYHSGLEWLGKAESQTLVLLLKKMGELF
jgi:hypothetical protein